MPTFALSLDWTDQGIRAIKDVPKRSYAARELGKKLNVDIHNVFLTTGEHDLLLIVEAPDGENVAKFALALSSIGNVRRRESLPSRRRDLHVDVTRPAGIERRHDGTKAEDAGRIGACLAVKLESHVALPRSLITGVHVNALVIGLPDLDPCTLERLSGTIKDLAVEDQHLARSRRAGAHPGEVGIRIRRLADRIVRPLRLRRS